MLRSSGYFKRLVCPFTVTPGGVGCQRPHCQFRHGEEKEYGDQSEELTGSDAELENDMEELHRINKAIEEVKTEVEEEQKKLSLYIHKPESPVTLSAPITDLNKNDATCSASKQLALVKDKPNITSILKKQNKTYISVPDKKYTIDRRCPATDLEYDPLLNYSASLLCSTSRLKRKAAISEDSQISPNEELNLSSPIKLEIKFQESDEDDLIIDVPPLQPVLKKPRMMKKESTLQTGEINRYLHSNDSDFDNNGEKCARLIKNKVVELVPSSLANGCMNQHEMESKQLPNRESNIFKEVKCDQNISLSLTVGNTFSPLGVGTTVEKEKSKKDESKKGLCQNEAHPLVDEMQQNCILNSTKHLKTEVSEEKLNEKPVHVEDCPKPDLPLLPVLQNNENVLNITSSSIVQPDQAMCIEISSQQGMRKASHCNKAIQESEIIVVDSSSEEESDHSEEDIDISESDDPMEECLRIFNEFAESELKKESAEQIIVEDDYEVDASDSKSADRAHASKKRIAHPAKFDANSNKDVFMPLREPVPQPASNVRILQAQQQAVQITSEVKSGQEFVAASASRRVIRSAMPTEVHRIGKIVYVNLVDHQQPSVTTQMPINRILQKKTFATLACNSTIPVKKISQPPSAKVSVRRRPSVVPEPGSKVPHEMRQRYVNFFVEEYLKVCSTVHDAFDKALTEEKGIYDRCGSKNMYLNISVNALKRLRDHRSVSSNNISPGKGNSVGAKKEEKNDFTGDVLCKLLTDYLLNEEQLKENGYPRANPEKPGSVLLYNIVNKTTVADSLRRVCCRCGETYAVTSEGKHVRKEECNYHSGKVLRQRVPGGLETRYSCCEAVVGTPGCQVAKLHVHDGQKDNMDGFMTTFKKLPPVDGNHGVFALDCEMCYTTQGLNLTRVTVVDPSLQVIYDTFVKPDSEIIDYNTRFSGISEDDLKNVTTTIRDVQAIMLNLFSAETILIGHGLENDLFALKLIHDKVVDTTIVFPHRLGLPHKRALRNLTADYLRRIIQDDVGGHDSREDASACMELLIWKVKEDTKGRRW